MNIDDLCPSCQAIVRRGCAERAQRYRDRKAALAVRTDKAEKAAAKILTRSRPAAPILARKR